MKTKSKNKNEHPFHLHLEYFFRKQYFLYFVLVLLMLAIVKSDKRVEGIFREAASGFGLVGEYMREETTRMPVTFNINARVPTYSGK